ncbi:MAG: hypothetical protein ACLGHY_06470 [Gammaproteobacteria bacterium]
MNHRHYLSPLFEPAGALLIVAHADPADEPPWAAVVRADFMAERGGTLKKRIAVLGAPDGTAAPAGHAIELAVIATPIESVAAALELAASQGARAALVLDRCNEPDLARALAERARALRIWLLGPGSILDAHTDGERVSKRELEEAVGLYVRLARTLLRDARAQGAGE